MSGIRRGIHGWKYIPVKVFLVQSVSPPRPMTHAVIPLMKEPVLFVFHLPDSRCIMRVVVTPLIFVCLTLGNIACRLTEPDDETAGSRMYRITSACFQNSDGDVLPVDLEDLYGGTNKVFLRMADAAAQACFYLVHDSCFSEMNMVERTENEFVSQEITDNIPTWMFTLGQMNDSVKIFFKSRYPLMNNLSKTGHFTFNVSGVEVDNVTADYDWPAKTCRLSDSLTVISDKEGE